MEVAAATVGFPKDSCSHRPEKRASAEDVRKSRASASPRAYISPFRAVKIPASPWNQLSGVMPENFNDCPHPVHYCFRKHESADPVIEGLSCLNLL
jgi:hypothetical protein